MHDTGGSGPLATFFATAIAIAVAAACSADAPGGSPAGGGGRAGGLAHGGAGGTGAGSNVGGQNEGAGGEGAAGTGGGSTSAGGSEPFEIDASMPNNFFDNVTFLFDGPVASQMGVDTSAFEPWRVAVVRGSVHDEDGQPFEDVYVSIKDHPEHGYTQSTSDGVFDLVVNGGGVLTVRFERDGYLPVDRTFSGAMDHSVIVSATDHVMFGVEVTGQQLCVRGSDDLFGWKKACPGEQILSVDDGFYNVTACIVSQFDDDRVTLSLMSRPWALLLVAVAACAKAPEPPSAPKETSSAAASASTSTPDGASEVPPRLRATLHKQAVHDRNFHEHRVLYTWTTKEQLPVLQKNRRLLFRSVSPASGPAMFDQLLTAGDDDDGLLRTEALKYRRFAWPNPWATLLGWEGERYGDVLIRVELRRDAFIGRFDAQGNAEPTTGEQQAADRWRFVDADGKVVSRAQVHAAPERLGAVYHIVQGARGADGTGAFREYVLCNESMIARWEIATDAVTNRIAHDRSMVKQLATYLPTAPGNWEAANLAAWRKSLIDRAWRTPPDAGIRELYGAAVALANDRYVLSPKSMAALSSELEGVVAHSAPLAHDVTVTYGAPLPGALRPAAPPRPPAPRPPCRPTGSFPCHR